MTVRVGQTEFKVRIRADVEHGEDADDYDWKIIQAYGSDQAAEKFCLKHDWDYDHILFDGETDLEVMHPTGCIRRYAVRGEQTVIYHVKMMSEKGAVDSQ
jgi:hypothetical protein